MAREDQPRLAKTSSSVMDLAREQKISCSTPPNVLFHSKLQEAFGSGEWEVFGQDCRRNPKR